MTFALQNVRRLFSMNEPVKVEPAQKQFSQLPMDVVRLIIGYIGIHEWRLGLTCKKFYNEIKIRDRIIIASVKGRMLTLIALQTLYQNVANENNRLQWILSNQVSRYNHAKTVETISKQTEEFLEGSDCEKGILSIKRKSLTIAQIPDGGVTCMIDQLCEELGLKFRFFSFLNIGQNDFFFDQAIYLALKKGMHKALVRDCPKKRFDYSSFVTLFKMNVEEVKSYTPTMLNCTLRHLADHDVEELKLDLVMRGEPELSQLEFLNDRLKGCHKVKKIRFLCKDRGNFDWVANRGLRFLTEGLSHMPSLTTLELFTLPMNYSDHAPFGKRENVIDLVNLIYVKEKTKTPLKVIELNSWRWSEESLSLFLTSLADYQGKIRIFFLNFFKFGDVKVLSSIELNPKVKLYHKIEADGNLYRFRLGK